MIYLTAIGLTPSGSSSVHIYTINTQYVTKQKIHRTTQKLGRMRAVPRFCGFYSGTCLTTEEKARKNLSQGSQYLSQGSQASVRLVKPQSG